MYSGAYNLIVIIFNRFNPGTAFIGFYNNNSVAPCQDIIFFIILFRRMHSLFRSLESLNP
jgi:hypothetical protein